MVDERVNYWLDSGAQPTEVFVKGLEQAWAELAGNPAFEEGAMCGPGGC